MPLSPGRISPRNMDDRQWAQFVAQSGIQADRTVKTFTPTWTGFSVDPVGDLSYMDFGAIVMIWTDNQLAGESSTGSMSFTGIPAAIRAGERRLATMVLDDNVPMDGSILMFSTGQVSFFVADTSVVANRVVPNSNGFTSSGTKGLPSGWILTYAKD